MLHSTKLRLKIVSVLAVPAACSALFATSAAAQDIGMSANGSIGISVTIQPWGDALRAQTDFRAVGLWTFGAGPGLMISAPSTSVVGAATEISLFAQHPSPLTVRSDTSSAPITASTGVFGRDLRQARFELKAVGSHQELGERNSQLFIIGTI